MQNADSFKQNIIKADQTANKATNKQLHKSRHKQWQM